MNYTKVNQFYNQQQQPFQNVNNYYNYNFYINQNINFPNYNNYPNFYMNNNNIQINNYQNNFSNFNGKPFTIIETEQDIYIVNMYKNDSIKIIRSNPNKIERINFQNIPINSTKQKMEVEGIIGIFDLNAVKYLGIITSSEEAAAILSSKVYVIKSIELIKITNTTESQYFINFKTSIKYLFSMNNFYYSNDYKLSMSQSSQNSIINYKYLMNYHLLKYFFDNNIPDYFYSQIIFGFVSSQNNIYLGNNQYNISLDIIIIERYFNGNIIMNNSNLVYIKQIELITIFKNNNNLMDNKIFSYISYISSESANNINVFVPFKIVLVEELKQFNNLVCVINNLNKDFKNKKIKETIDKYNKSFLNNKISITNFSSEWKQVYFEGIDIEKNVDIYFNNIFQQTAFWFIDVNNDNFQNNICIESLRRLFWKIIQKEINIQMLNIDIGNFSQNNDNIVCKKFREITELYQNDMYSNKTALLLNEDKKIFQELFNNILSLNSNNEPLNKDNRIEEELNSENVTKLKILCVTWNVGGAQLKGDFDFSDIFKNNQFYTNGQTPDFIVISIQEIVDLNTKNILKSSNNQNNIKIWIQRIKDTLKNVFPEKIYIDPIKLDLVGLFFILLVKQDVLGNIVFNDISEDKKGKFSFGNKGFLTFSFKYMEKIFSMAACHLESGGDKNAQRIKTLKEILNKDIKVDSDKIHKFKEADFWIILGDFNFRVNLSYENAIGLIQDKNYHDLLSMDQFRLTYEDDQDTFLKDNIDEGTINFGPTYKFEKNSDSYDYKDNKIRVPSWCDRIFYKKRVGIRNLNYNGVFNLRLSDHKPVIAALEFLLEKSGENKK